MYQHVCTHAVTRKLRSSLLLLAVLIISPASFAAQDPNPNGKYFISNPLVLLTGVTDYKAGIKDLPDVKDDMQAFHELFTTKCGYETYGTCLDENHRVKNKFALSQYDLEQFIQEKKQYLAQNVDKFDALIFIFSGHGHGNGRGNDTICTSDGKKMYWEDLKKKFTSINNFGSHPKLFLKLACRGSERQGSKNRDKQANLEEEDEKTNQVRVNSNLNYDNNNKTANIYSFYASAPGYVANTHACVDVARAWLKYVGNALGKDDSDSSLASIVDSVKTEIMKKYKNNTVQNASTLRETKVFFKWGVPTVAQQLIDKHESLMIMEALKLGNTDFVNYLLDHGKGITFKQTHMDYAYKSSNLALVKYLKNKVLEAENYHLKKPQLLGTLEGHTNSVYSVAYRPDGKQLASASYDYTLKLWDTATGKCVRTLFGHKYPVMSVAYSPDGKQLASASYDKTLKLWDLATGKCVHTLEGHTDWVYSVTYSPDGRQLASGSGNWLISQPGEIKLWNVATGACQHTLKAHMNRVWGVAYSPDGAQLASTSGDYTLKLWDPATGQCIHTLSGHTSNMHSIAYSPDGKQLASASDDKTLKLWDLATGQCVRTLSGHTSNMHSIAYSPDGKQLASASSDKTVKLWDPATGQCQHTLSGHTDGIFCVAYAWTGRQLASGASDKTIKLWGSR